MGQIMGVMDYSGADNGTNHANCDTSTKFGTTVLCRLLVKSAQLATWQSKMAAIFSTWPPFLPNIFFLIKMYIFVGFQYS